jgi:uncharacterized alkaline shock family protein YloU
MIQKEEEEMVESSFKKNSALLKMDAKEIDLPETVFSRDIDNKVFQEIILQCLAKIKGISVTSGNLIDSLLGRDLEKIKNIHVEQDQKRHSVFIKVEVNVIYGISIPEKAEEIQNRIIEEITTYTGLHVSGVHIIFKNLITESQLLQMEANKKTLQKESDEEYSRGF